MWRRRAWSLFLVTGRRARLLWGLLRVECVVGKWKSCISGCSYLVAKGEAMVVN